MSTPTDSASSDTATQFDDDDLTPREIVGHKIGGREVVAVEASEEVACRWRGVMLNSAQLEDGKVTGMGGMAQAAAVLIAGCMFWVNGTGKREPIDAKTVRGWPHRITKKWFERIKGISDLQEQEETVEAVDAEIAKLQKRRAKLVKDQGPEKNESGAGAST